MQKAAIVSLARRLGEEVQRDPFLLASREGITVSFCPFSRQRGAYCVVSGVSLLLLNGRLSREESLRVCAHEMGHHFLHAHRLLPLNGHRDSPFIKRAEREADLFAAAFLLPEGTKS